MIDISALHSRAYMPLIAPPVHASIVSKAVIISTLAVGGTAIAMIEKVRSWLSCLWTQLAWLLADWFGWRMALRMGVMPDMTGK